MGVQKEGDNKKNTSTNKKMFRRTMHATDQTKRQGDVQTLMSTSCWDCKSHGLPVESARGNPYQTYSRDLPFKFRWLG